MNQNTAHLEVTLDWLAHAKVSDFFVPIKRDKLGVAKELVQKILRDVDNGFDASETDIRALYDRIDPSGQ